MTFPKPIIFVSKCLGFAACRYDGDNLHNKLIESLGKHATFITECPEVAIGLGVPRKPIRLSQESGELKLIQPATGKDLTQKMQTFSEKYLNSIKEPDAFILKYRSPSCGPNNVKIYMGDKKKPLKGPGLFAATIRNKFPESIIEDEGRLLNFSIREHFFIKVFTLAKFKEIKNIKELIKFQEQNKLLFMAMHQQQAKVLGRIVASYEKKNFEDLKKTYKSELLELLRKRAKYHSWINALNHAYSGVKEKLSDKEREYFKEKIEEYRDERIPLSVLTSLIESWAVRFNNDFLLGQSILELYPKELITISDSGKGRNL